MVSPVAYPVSLGGCTTKAIGDGGGVSLSSHETPPLGLQLRSSASQPRRHLSVTEGPMHGPAACVRISS